MKYSVLNESQVIASRKEHGVNLLTPPEKESLWKQFVQTLTGPLGHLIPGWENGDSLVFILEIAALLSGFISFSEYYGWLGLEASYDAKVFFEPVGIIMAIVLATGISFYFEVKANREFEILNQVNDDEPVKVIRSIDGKEKVVAIPRRDIVVGDVLMLSTGEEVPADCELLEATSLSIDESTLTGEPICHKTVNEAEFDTNATFPSNHVMRGTKVMEGHCVCRVFAVGDKTENGKVFTAAQITDNVKTPLDEQFDRLGFVISVASYIIGILVFVGRIIAYLHTGNASISDPQFLPYALQSLMIAVTLVVCAVPEGLPMAVSLSLALSMRRMLKTNNLVRKIHACETMGATTVICTDKTGTLTQNKMQVSEIFPEFGEDMKLNMAINSTAIIGVDSEGNETILGNPTEGALLLYLRDNGVDYAKLRSDAKVIDEVPFSTERKYMATTISNPSCVSGSLPTEGSPMLSTSEYVKSGGRGRLFASIALALCVTGASAQLTTNNGQQYLLNQALDMSQQFFDMSNTYFTADSLAAFDKATGVGKIKWARQQLHARQAFNANGQWIIPLENLDFPGPAYDQSPELQFTVEPVNSRTVRVRLYTSPIIPKDNYDDEVMLVKKPADGRAQWNVSETDKAIVYKSSEGSIEIQKYP